ncbi:MAG TPA: hypothetical protein VIL86_10545 [Tepidisphaeraceae bacterium]|jgi:DNA repair ATPase RecN
MNEQDTFISRIGKWFRRGSQPNGELPPLEHGDDGSATGTMIEPRSTFLRPWAKRDAALSNLQEGFTTLTDLMTAVRDNLQKQTERQDELLQYLSHLPEAIKQIPESNRVQGEALRAIHQQMEQQNSQQRTIADVLNKISDTSGGHKQILDALNERVENLNQHDEKISDNLSSVGNAMQTVSRNSQTSAQVLEQMRDNINSRDGELERIMHKQGNRFTTLLAIAIFLSVAALAAVSVIGYLGYEALSKMK